MFRLTFASIRKVKIIGRFNGSMVENKTYKKNEAWYRGQDINLPDVVELLQAQFGWHLQVSPQAAAPPPHVSGEKKQ